MNYACVGNSPVEAVREQPAIVRIAADVGHCHGEVGIGLRTGHVPSLRPLFNHLAGRMYTSPTYIRSTRNPDPSVEATPLSPAIVPIIFPRLVLCMMYARLIRAERHAAHAPVRLGYTQGLDTSGPPSPRPPRTQAIVMVM